MKKKKWLIPVAVVLALVLLGTAVFGAVTTLKIVPVSVNIIPAPEVKSIEVYSDAQLNHPLTSINIGDIEAGSESTTKWFYVKNTGTVELYLEFITEDISAWGTISWGPDGSFFLSPTAYAICWIRLSIDLDAEIGPKNFDLYINEA